MSLVTRALEDVTKGRLGENVGIPLAFPKLREFIPDIQKGEYFLIGGALKSGKSAITDDIFLYGVWDFINNTDSDIVVDIDYYSFEINPKMKIIKGIARELWKKYGLIVDVNEILSKGKKYCSDEIYDLVIETAKYFENFDDFINIHSLDNPTGISKYLWDKAALHGEIVKKNINQDPDGVPVWRFDHYKPHNPNRHWIIVIDHVGLTLPESGMSIKETMDLLSKKLVAIRDNFNATIVVVQQLSFETTNDERFKTNRLTPTLRDFSESRFLARDASIIMALFSPYSIQAKEFHGYNITKLGNSFRNLEILENRNGEPGINIGLNFIGNCGHFRELPIGTSMTDLTYKHASEYVNGKSKYIKNESGVYVERN